MEYISREIKILSEIKSERVVQYINTYIDFNNILHIQMEFCSDNLKNILDYKRKTFKREKNKEMNDWEYYISCKILIELVEALCILHKQSPSIIHRDIKPANILFTENGRQTGIFFKLCDFGLAKTIEHISKSVTDINTVKKFVSTNENTEVLPYLNNSRKYSENDNYTSTSTSNTIGVGTNRYMAPEVWDGKYDTKADVYSLAIVGQQLFDIDNNSNRSDELKQQFERIVIVLEEMKNINYNMRQSCSEILNEKDNWCLNYIPINYLELYNNCENRSLYTYTKYHSECVSS